MNISVIGLGYVGIVTSSCFSSLGHIVYGCDLSIEKVDKLSEGKMPFIEPKCEYLLKQSIKNRLFFPSIDLTECLDNADLVFICVGTPPAVDGSVDLSSIKKVIKEIGNYISIGEKWLGVCIRSTIPIGTTRNTIIPMLEHYSNKKVGTDFSVAFCPEFLREGNAVEDFLKPTVQVVANSDHKIEKIMKNLWGSLDSSFKYFDVSFEDAELYKYASNAFHALKITFANEIGLISESVKSNGQKVMEILVSDTSLNISEKYLKPGFAFGGSCLPKDLKSIEFLSAEKKLNIPVLNSIQKSNDLLIKNRSELISKEFTDNVGISGFTFKEGTDDLRESSVLKLIYLIKNNFNYISIYDKNIDQMKLLGENKLIWDDLMNISNVYYYNDPLEFLDSTENLVFHGKQKEIFSLINKNKMKKNIFRLN